MTPALQDGPVMVFHGDALDVLREMPDESVHCVVTSPPYWGLRDYGTASWVGGDEGCDHVSHEIRTGLGMAQLGEQYRGGGHKVSETKTIAYRDVCGKCGARRVDSQLGLEATPDEYVANMVRLFREVRRVLRRDATLWLNLGDSFQNKQLVGMPWRVAFALQRDGWILRSDVIWAKANPMPESVTDRPTNSHEHVFLLTREPRYFYDADAVREAWADDRMGAPGGHKAAERNVGGRIDGFTRPAQDWTAPEGRAGRNLRSVWQIATQPYSEAHFATYPEALVLPCVKAGTSEKGCCPACGAPWRRVVERTAMQVREGPGRAGLQSAATNGTTRTAITGTMLSPASSQTTGWQPSCACGHTATVPATVLDPFAGSGTTLAVARRLGRRSIGIELSASYIDTLIRPRVTDSALPLLELMEEQGA